MIETAPPVGDGADGLWGVWQPGSGAGSGGGVSTNEGRRGKEEDDKAKKRDQVRRRRKAWSYVFSRSYGRAILTRRVDLIGGESDGASSPGFDVDLETML